MIVRCGRCRVELEVAGAGEFLCPNCGTRNMVRGSPAEQPLGYDLGDLSGLPRTPPPVPEGLPAGLRWVHCPSCRYRFVLGEVEAVVCPNCSAKLERRGEELVQASES